VKDTAFEQLSAQWIEYKRQEKADEVLDQWMIWAVWFYLLIVACIAAYKMG